MLHSRSLLLILATLCLFTSNFRVSVADSNTAPLVFLSSSLLRLVNSGLSYDLHNVTNLNEQIISNLLLSNDGDSQNTDKKIEDKVNATASINSTNVPVPVIVLFNIPNLAFHDLFSSVSTEKTYCSFSNFFTVLHHFQKGSVVEYPNFQHTLPLSTHISQFIRDTNTSSVKEIDTTLDDFFPVVSGLSLNSVNLLNIDLPSYDSDLGLCDDLFRVSVILEILEDLNIKFACIIYKDLYKAAHVKASEKNVKRSDSASAKSIHETTNQLVEILRRYPDLPSVKALRNASLISRDQRASFLNHSTIKAINETNSTGNSTNRQYTSPGLWMTGLSVTFFFLMVVFTIWISFALTPPIIIGGDIFTYEKDLAKKNK